MHDFLLFVFSIPYGFIKSKITSRNISFRQKPFRTSAGVCRRIGRCIGRMAGALAGAAGALAGAFAGTSAGPLAGDSPVHLPVHAGVCSSRR